VETNINLTKNGRSRRVRATVKENGNSGLGQNTVVLDWGGAVRKKKKESDEPAAARASRRIS